MPDIFTYHNYRDFLRDYYGEKKEADPSFSYQNFSRKAGFSSKSFVFNVINGRKNLSRASVVKLCESLKLSKSEAAYFENLVYFNQASNFTERNFYFTKLNAVVPANCGNGARKLRMDQYEFYSKWYHVVIRSLIDLYPGVNDFATLARMVHPPITGKQAKGSVELLLRLGLVEKKADGPYRVTDKIVSTGHEVGSLAVTNFHLECMNLAAKALREIPAGKRDVSGLTLGISENAYNKILEILHSSQQEILSVAEKDTGSDRVYQLNFHLFPVAVPSSPERRQS